MYKIFADGLPLYAPVLASEGYTISAGSVNVEIDKTGSAELTIPPCNPILPNLKKMKTVIQVINGDEQIFRGRILSASRDFNNNVELYVEGELAFLIDAVVEPEELVQQSGTSVASMFTWLVAKYNSQAEEYRRFATRFVTIQGTVPQLEVSPTDYKSVWDVMNEVLVNNFGGHIRTYWDATTEINYIDYIGDYDNLPNAQTIEFGVNLIDFEEEVSCENVVTSIIPLGKEVGEGDSKYRVTIASVNGGSIIYENQDYINQYGRIRRVVTFDDVEDPAILLQRTIEYMNQVNTNITTFTITAVDLYAINPSITKFHVGDLINVVSRPHTINTNSTGIPLRCEKISLDLLDPASEEYTFGPIPGTLTENANATSSQVSANEQSNVTSSANIAKLSTTVGGHEDRITFLEKNANIIVTPDTVSTIAELLSYNPDWKVMRYYFGQNCTIPQTEWPGYTGDASTEHSYGVLEIQKLPQSYAYLTYYADNGIVWYTTVTAGTVNQWKKVQWVS